MSGVLFTSAFMPTIPPDHQPRICLDLSLSALCVSLFAAEINGLRT